MASDEKNGNSGMVRRIVEPLIVALIVGLLVMYGTVRILETKMDAIQITVVETRQAQKDDTKQLSNHETRISIIESKQTKVMDKIFDTEAWERRKR